METDQIGKIEIDKEGRLHIKPEKVKFPLIYRSATEVHWNSDKQTLYSPKPREWSYSKWFKYIIDVAKKEAFCQLQLTDHTEWVNIPEYLKSEIKRVF